MAGIQHFANYRCRRGHATSQWHPKNAIPETIACPGCGLLRRASRTDTIPRTAVETTGIMPEILFAHKNYGLVPSSERLKAAWKKRGILLYDESGMPYVQVDTREQLRALAIESGIGLLSGEGKVDRLKQLGLTEEEIEKNWDTPAAKAARGVPGPSMAKRLATNLAFRKKWEARMRGGKTKFV